MAGELSFAGAVLWLSDFSHDSAEWYQDKEEEWLSCKSLGLAFSKREFSLVVIRSFAIESLRFCSDVGSIIGRGRTE